MSTEKHVPQKESIADSINKYRESREVMEGNIASPDNHKVETASIPTPPSYVQNSVEHLMGKETDPDLITSYEIVKLPSKGLFYSHKTSELMVEYMTSRDEDLLTTPSLLENGTALDILLKRKIKTKGIEPGDLLLGDRNAIVLSLRTSSYGKDYSVMVNDPRTGIPFKSTVNLLKLKYKEIKEFPDNDGYFTVELPMRKKIVKFKLLTSGEEISIFKNAEALKETYNEEFSQYNTLKLKSHIVSIGDVTKRDYINKFVDAMPALDALTIRRKVSEVNPDVDMSYEFVAKDGYKFKTSLSIGVDFFFPNI